MLGLLLATTLATTATADQPAIEHAPGQGEGHLTVDDDATTMRYAYAFDTEGEACPWGETEPTRGVRVTSVELDEATRAEAWRWLKLVREGKVASISLRFCHSGRPYGLELQHPKLGDAGYLTLPNPYPIETHSAVGEALAGRTAVLGGKFFMTNYSFDVSFDLRKPVEVGAEAQPDAPKPTAKPNR